MSSKKANSTEFGKMVLLKLPHPTLNYIMTKILKYDTILHIVLYYLTCKFLKLF